MCLNLARERAYLSSLALYPAIKRGGDEEEEKGERFRVGASSWGRRGRDGIENRSDALVRG